MKYLTFVAAAGVIGTAVHYGLDLTRNPNCLWGLLLLFPIAGFAFELGKKDLESRR